MNELFGLKGYGQPGPKAKFQIGDEVKIEDVGKWDSYHSAKSRQAIDQIGEIVGYKYAAGAYSKYAVKLSNGSIFGLHSHFLRRPTEEEIKMRKMMEELPELKGIF
jgi:hypothetical protein